MEVNPPGHQPDDSLSRLSRRDFLRVIGAGALATAASMLPSRILVQANPNISPLFLPPEAQKPSEPRIPQEIRVPSVRLRDKLADHARTHPKLDTQSVEFEPVATAIGRFSVSEDGRFLGSIERNANNQLVINIREINHVTGAIGDPHAITFPEGVTQLSNIDLHGGNLIYTLGKNEAGVFQPYIYDGQHWQLQPQDSYRRRGEQVALKPRRDLPVVGTDRTYWGYTAEGGPNNSGVQVIHYPGGMWTLDSHDPKQPTDYPLFSLNPLQSTVDPQSSAVGILYGAVTLGDQATNLMDILWDTADPLDTTYVPLSLRIKRIFATGSKFALHGLTHPDNTHQTAGVAQMRQVSIRERTYRGDFTGVDINTEGETCTFACVQGQKDTDPLPQAGFCVNQASGSELIIGEVDNGDFTVNERITLLNKPDHIRLIKIYTQNGPKYVYIEQTFQGSDETSGEIKYKVFAATTPEPSPQRGKFNLFFSSLTKSK